MYNYYDYYYRDRPYYDRWYDYGYWRYRPYYDYPYYNRWYNGQYASINQDINNFGSMQDVWQSAIINQTRR